MLLHLYAAGHLPAYGCDPGMPLPLSLLLFSAHLILLIFFLLKYRYERVYKLFQAHLVFLQLPFDVFLYLAFCSVLPYRRSSVWLRDALSSRSVRRWGLCSAFWFRAFRRHCSDISPESRALMFRRSKAFFLSDRSPKSVWANFSLPVS